MKGSPKPIALAVWDEFVFMLSKTFDSSGNRIKLAVKGARKKAFDVNWNSHIGSTSEVFIVSEFSNLYILHIHVKLCNLMCIN